MGCLKPSISISRESEISYRRKKIENQKTELKEEINNSELNYQSENTDNKKIENEIPNKSELQIPSKKIPLNIIQTKKNLQLEIIETKYLQKGKIIAINPGGIINSERNQQDGISYFGVSNVK
jgi:hypothetical protein